MFTVSRCPEDSNPGAAAGKEKQGSTAGRVYRQCRSTRPVNNAVIWRARKERGEAARRRRREEGKGKEEGVGVGGDWRGGGGGK